MCGFEPAVAWPAVEKEKTFRLSQWNRTEGVLLHSNLPPWHQPGLAFPSQASETGFSQWYRFWPLGICYFLFAFPIGLPEWHSNIICLGPGFELTWCPSRALKLATYAAFGTIEIQGHRQVWCTRRWGPRTLSRASDVNLDCAFVENALFYTPILDWEKSTKCNWVSD